MLLTEQARRLKECTVIDIPLLKKQNVILKSTQQGSSDTIAINCLKWTLEGKIGIIYAGQYNSLRQQMIDCINEWAQLLNLNITAKSIHDFKNSDKIGRYIYVGIYQEKNYQHAGKIVGRHNVTSFVVNDESDLVSPRITKQVIKDWMDNMVDKAADYVVRCSATNMLYALEDIDEYPLFWKLPKAKNFVDIDSILDNSVAINEESMENLYTGNLTKELVDIVDSHETELMLINIPRKSNEDCINTAMNISRYTKKIGVSYTQDGFIIYNSDGTIYHNFRNVTPEQVLNKIPQIANRFAICVNRLGNRGIRFKTKDIPLRAMISCAAQDVINTIQMNGRLCQYVTDKPPILYSTQKDLDIIKDDYVCYDDLKTAFASSKSREDFISKEIRASKQRKIVNDNRKLNGHFIQGFARKQERDETIPLATEYVILDNFDTNLHYLFYHSHKDTDRYLQESFRKEVRNKLKDYPPETTSNMRVIYRRKKEGGGNDTNVYVNRNRTNSVNHEDRKVLVCIRDDGRVGCIITKRSCIGEPACQAHDENGNLLTFRNDNKQETVIRFTA